MRELYWCTVHMHTVDILQYDSCDWAQAAHSSYNQLFASYSNFQIGFCVLDFLCCHLHRIWVNTLSSVINQVRARVGGN